MYRMMIVEDEEIEREYLQNFINWNDMGIEVAAAFESGEEALEFAGASEVDILLTDIKLIGMSGLQLAKKLLERKPDIKVVILSGYQEFDYAREAIELQAFSFLTKPVETEELKSTFEKVISRCLTEQNDRLQRERLSKMIERNMPVLKSKFFDDLIQGRLSEQEIERNLEYFGLDVSSCCYNVLISEIDSYESLTEGMEPSDVHMLIVKVLDCLDSVKNNFGARIVTFHVKDGRYCTLMGIEASDAGNLHQLSLHLAEKLQERLNTHLKLDATVGIGKGVGSLKDLKFSFKTACDAVAFKFYMGINQIIHYNDVYYNESSSIIDLDETGRKIVTAVGLCDRDNLDKRLAALFDEIRKNSCTDLYIRNLCINLLSKLSVMLQDMHDSFGKIFGSEALVWEKILKLDTVFDIQMWLRNVFNAVIDYLAEKKSGSNKKIISEILRFIDENYHKNISIADISHKVYLSPNYISIIFKKETGESFTNFLIRYRMEKAAQMLKDTTLKVYEIGNRVGYENTSHFCAAFKKLYGVSPNEYRERI